MVWFSFITTDPEAGLESGYVGYMLLLMLFVLEAFSYLLPEALSLFALAVLHFVA